MNETITFGGWLKQRRNELGVTQDELAERLGYSPVMLGKIEAGARRPSGQIVTMLADYFRVPDDEREAFAIFARAGRAEGVSIGVLDGGGTLAPWRAAASRYTNLPLALTPLIGREEEEGALLDLLLQPPSRARLVTLTGAPGIGKTRLALQVASKLVERFDEGVYFVELAPVSDPEMVVSAIAQTLGVREVGGQAIEGMLRQHMQSRRMLLVLDNFEQVLDAAPAVSALVEASPWLKMLVTSREALHVRGERRFPVLPLAVPNLSQTEDLHALVANSSIQLFVERAQAVQPGFTLTQENARDVAAICARLEGLPLAIELAAARARFLSPQAMLLRLEDRLDVLTGGARDLPERQRALRSTIEWSYDLLSDGEQELFRRLSVFVGGFTREAAEAVCDLEVGDRGSVLERLESLVDKSLLNVGEGFRRNESADRAPRFTMLEMISEYAFERLKESAESREVQERHAGYFLRLAEEAEPELRGPQQIAWLNRLDMEHDNIRAALRWALESKASGIGLRLVGALRWFWTLRSYLSEGLRWARAALAMPDAKARSAARARALWSAGALAWQQGDPQARAFLEESVALWREIGDKRGLGHALSVLAMAVLQQGQPETAHALQLESVEVLRAAGAKLELSLALNALSISMWALEDAGASNYHVGYKEHRAWHEEAVQLARETGDVWNLALQLRGLGWAAMRQGRYAEARSLYQESLALHGEIGTRHEAAATHGDLGQLAQLEGDFGAALEHYERSLDLFRDCADSHGMVNSLASIGGVALRKSNVPMAVEALTTALAMVKELGSLRYSLVALDALGWLMVGLAQPTRAALLLSAVEALYKVHPFLRPIVAQIEHDRYLESARAQVDRDTWEEAWARGETMSIEEALQFASDSLATSGHTTTEEQA